MYPIVFVKTMGIEHPEMERNRKYFRVYAKTRKKKYFLFSLGTQDFKISFSEVTKLKKKKKLNTQVINNTIHTLKKKRVVHDVRFHVTNK